MKRTFAAQEISSRLAITACLILFSACNNDGSHDPAAVSPIATMADTSDIVATDSIPGVTPFISFVRLRGADLSKLKRIAYVIKPLEGAASKAVSVKYVMDMLRSRGYFGSGDSGTIPVFGLYAGRHNDVSITLTFNDQSSREISIGIAADAYVDPAGIYDRPKILTKRLVGSTLGFNYFALKTSNGAPVVVDTDGNIRWMAVGLTNSFSSIFLNNAFLIGASDSSALYSLELDGSVTSRRSLPLASSPSYLLFHHNIDPGRDGLLVEVNTSSDGVTNIESTLAEIAPSGVVLKEWDLAAIFRNYMEANGDDPALFVRPGIDWLHTNGAVYDSRDDSLIISSRESFIFKIDYDTGKLLWVLGDPTKYWYSFASLRAKALTLVGGGLYPIGQHAPSITTDGLLMVFNDGAASFNQPAGAPSGATLTFSAVSAYAISAESRNAQEIWRFDNQQSIFSDICSSAYEGEGRSLLINYSAAEQRTKSRVIGLNASREVVFDFEYQNPFLPCSTSWSAVPIPFEELEFG